MEYYFIVPAVATYLQDPETGQDTTTLVDLRPADVAGNWMADCKDGANFLIKTDCTLKDREPLNDRNFQSELERIGFNPVKVLMWGKEA